MPTVKTTKTAPTEPVAYDWSQPSEVSGMENVTQTDLGVPFLSLLQKGSAECDKAHPQYATKKITGSEAGDIINTLTREILYKGGSTTPLIFLPCAYDRVYVEWKPQSSGGGIVRTHRNANILNECTRDEDTGKDILRNGNNVVTTAMFYGLVLRPSYDPMSVVLSLSSTQLKQARAWLNMAQAIKLNGPNGKFTPPLFSHTYQLSSGAESNAKGSWMGLRVHIDKMVNDGKLVETAKDIARLSLESATKVKELPVTSGDHV